MGVGMYKFSRWWLRRLFAVRGLEKRGFENVPPEGPLIVACNHASYIDPTLLGAAFDRVLRYMARKSLFDSPLFGAYIRSNLAFPVDREGDSREALRAFGEQLALGHAVVLFPEGTRTVTGRLGDIKAGVGMLAVRNHAPVLPVYVWGTYLAWPKGKRLPWFHRMKVLCAPCVVPRDCATPAERKAEQRRVTEEVAAALARLDEEAWAGEEPAVPLALPPPKEMPALPPPASPNTSESAEQ